ncbi:hypothetical protein BB560_000890 [Smittium megazygosporum]|uniref:Uncharacterized protein n=1 Tax=Smittium megazygosporum TaxID=133381 RepID=A0A2T9ZJ49_9FUNG|nr:hypothetical protein BB560_000890 [Smittium megazygosporum]
MKFLYSHRFRPLILLLTLATIAEFLATLNICTLYTVHSKEANFPDDSQAKVEQHRHSPNQRIASNLSKAIENPYINKDFSSQGPLKRTKNEKGKSPYDDQAFLVSENNIDLDSSSEDLKSKKERKQNKTSLFSKILNLSMLTLSSLAFVLKYTFTMLLRIIIPILKNLLWKPIRFFYTSIILALAIKTYNFISIIFPFVSFIAVSIFMGLWVGSLSAWLFTVTNNYVEQFYSKRF